MGGLSLSEEVRAELHAAIVATNAGPIASSAALHEVAEKSLRVCVDHDTRPTACAWRAFAASLKAAGRLVDWKEAVRQAEHDGRRHLDSAHLLAQEALQGLDPDDPVVVAVGRVLTAITEVTSPAEVDSVVADLRKVPLPIPLAEPPPYQGRGRPAIESADAQPDPIAVALFELDGEPAPDATLIPANRFTDLRLELRLTEWPEWADELHATAVSVAGDNASFPTFRFSRPEERDKEGFWTVVDAGKLVVRAVQALGDEPLTFTLLTEFVSAEEGRRRPVRTAGQRELRLWASDDPSSFFTAFEQLDRRVAQILAAISNNNAFGAEPERKAFIRFLRGLLRATTTMQTRAFYRDAVTDERRFQHDLLVLLDQQDALHGRVQEGSEVGGGETDLVHDGIVAELKVEKTTPVTKENAPQFLGQTTSYASGLGSQLGIAVVLDLSTKTHPLAHPANYVHWFETKLHGITDPAYPSHVAVLVVNGRTPLPSDFAGRKSLSTDAFVADEG